jgi:hypothetical protein
VDLCHSYKTAPVESQHFLGDRDLEEVMAQRTLRLSKLEHSPELPWQRLCKERFAITTEDIYVVEV